MDLLIFILVISGLTGLSIWLSKTLYQIKESFIFLPSAVLIGFTIISGTLASVLNTEYSLLFAVGVFVFAPSGLITLVYALNHHHVHKKNT